MGLNIFTDFHHAGLLHSLILLFEDRLDGAVYRPIGREWYEKGFWKIYEHPATVAQYLDIGGATPDGTPPLNEVETTTKTPDPIYFCQDIDSGYFNKAITYSGFMSRHFDIVIASIPDHIEPFKKLCELHPDKPKLIFQIGNAWTTGAGLAPNIMASAIINEVPQDINFISYHQEFNPSIFHQPIKSTKDIRGYVNSYDWSLPDKNIYSFVNVFDKAGHFAADWQLFTQLEQMLPDYKFRAYGGQCRDGSKNGDKEVAAGMVEARFIWHTKAGGDGYGHIIHNAPAIGRPLIIKRQYYVGKMAEPLLEDGKTCICIDNLAPEEIINKIRYYEDPARYEELAKGAYARFKEVVNFDTEAEKIKEFLAKLK